ncbi:MAG TPA: glycoside hydrolase family 3 C-terminal domain-containing protein, partial [Candidatus Acidoferrum sp.]|nr:glycoside hydrolase family 3 C-terminal domain-containing protein [Candidatus Acidoferrum sp.]
DEKLLDSASHRTLARKMANESMVLLKNNGILPIKVPGPGLKIAVVGPLANQTKVLMGNYSSTPTHAVSVLDGLKTEFPTAKINFVEGTQFLSKNAAPVPSALLTTGGKPGVRSTYSTGSAFSFGPGAKPPTVLATRIDPAFGTPSGPPPSEIQGKKSVLISSEATLTPTETADYYLGSRCNGFNVVTLDDKVIVLSFSDAGVETKLARVHLEAGKPHTVKVSYRLPGSDPRNPSSTAPELVWAKFDPRPAPEAIAAAKSADIVIAVVGITSELEGEEMPINEEGFAGGDRTSLDLPKPEEDLLEAVAAAGKPLIVVLMNGSALSVNWAKDHANAILESWYAGEEGGAAIAETISGKNNPAGRLPVTFYTGVSQLPPFEDYGMKNRTYRYFDGTPLYPFGYGLSYTTFSFSDLKLSTSAINAGDSLNVEATVTNKGKLPGDEVAELYLSFPKVPGAPNIALRGFQRLHLDPGASQKVQFTLDSRDLSIVTEAGSPVVPEGECVLWVGGGQPHATPAGEPRITAAGTGQTFRIKGSITLPE